MTVGQTSIDIGRSEFRPVLRDAAANHMAPLNVKESDALLAAVDFKWLMAGRGWHVEIARLRADRAYAAHFLGLAMHSGYPALCDRANSLLTQIETSGSEDSGDRSNAGRPA